MKPGVRDPSALHENLLIYNSYTAVGGRHSEGGRHMSDISQGPDSWLGSDAVSNPPRYPRQPPPLPPSEVLAVQKSVRRWGCFVPLGVVGLIVLAIIVFVIIAVVNISSSNFLSGLDGLKGLVGNGDTVSIANTTVSATWSRSPAATPGSTSICAAVRIVNHNNSTISYNEQYWSLQSLNGTVDDQTNVNTAGGLGSGDLVAGGTVAGTVCFDDPGGSEPFTGIYKPDPLKPARGRWLVPLPDGSTGTGQYLGPQ
jgi:Domain of unknown function (DUF4352)